MTKLAICFSSLVACAPLVAQATPVYGLVTTGLNPPGFTIGAFGRSVSAELTGHQLPDIVALATEDGGAGREVAVLLGAPGVHNSAVLLPNTADKRVRDVAVIRGGDPDSDRDALVLVTDQGLFRWQSGGGMTQFGGANWNNATRVEVGDVDGDGVVEAIGKMGNAISGNPQNVRCTSIGGVAAWMVNTGAPILDLAVVDWVNGPGPVRDEVAVVHQNAVHFVVDGAIAPALSVTLPLCESARVVALRTTAGDARLVVGITDSTGSSMLVTISPGSPVLACRPVGRPIGGLTTVENGDERGVVAAIATNANLIHFVHDEVAYPAEALGPGANLRSAPQPANGAADARLLDLDADGDLDLVSSMVGSGFVIDRVPGTDPWGGGRPVLVSSAGQVSFRLPEWADAMETLHFQFTTVWAGSSIASMKMSPIGLSRAVTPRGAYFNLGDTWPAHGNIYNGPVVTLSRAIQSGSAHEIVRRGPFRLIIWTRTGWERSYVTQLVTGGALEAVVYVPQSSTLETLIYDGLAPGLAIVYPDSPGTVWLPGYIPGAVESPSLPPPDEEQPTPPEGGEQGSGG